MVKLELVEHGRSAYVSPMDINGIREIENGVVMLERRGLSALYVKGTPDEVHTKLFATATAEPAPFTEEWLDEGGPRWAAMQVLEWMASEDVPLETPPSMHLVRLARKALGREGT